jgi:hypothetical protein
MPVTRASPMRGWKVRVTRAESMGPFEVKLAVGTSGHIGRPSPLVLTSGLPPRRRPARAPGLMSAARRGCRWGRRPAGRLAALGVTRPRDLPSQPSIMTMAHLPGRTTPGGGSPGPRCAQAGIQVSLKLRRRALAPLSDWALNTRAFHSRRSGHDASQFSRHEDCI